MMNYTEEQNMTIYLYIPEALADMEIAQLLVEVNSGRFLRKDIGKPRIVKVGSDKSPVTSMGGLQYTPDIDVDSMNLKDDDLLVLPGGMSWQNGNHAKILEAAKKAKANKNITLAAICGATVFLADNGLFDDIKHTSNALAYLKMFCKNYHGENLYVDKPAVSEENLITASEFGYFDWTYEVLKKINVMKAETLEAWNNLYKTNEARYFMDIMKSLDQYSQLN
jgi:putative intracellular protease/amidase